MSPRPRTELRERATDADPRATLRDRKMMYQRTLLFENGTGGYRAYTTPTLLTTGSGAILAICEGRNSDPKVLRGQEQRPEGDGRRLRRHRPGAAAQPRRRAELGAEAGDRAHRTRHRRQPGAGAGPGNRHRLAAVLQELHRRSGEPDRRGQGAAHGVGHLQPRRGRELGGAARDHRRGQGSHLELVRHRTVPRRPTGERAARDPLRPRPRHGIRLLRHRNVGGGAGGHRPFAPHLQRRSRGELADRRCGADRHQTSARSSRPATATSISTAETTWVRAAAPSPGAAMAGSPFRTPATTRRSRNRSARPACRASPTP